VTSSTAVTGTPSERMWAAVDPVETISTPASCSPRANSSSPDLVVDADQRAANRDLAHGMVTFLPVIVQPSRGHPSDGLDEHLALGDLDPLVQCRLVVVVEHRHRALGDDRPGVDAVVHDEQRAAGDLDAVVERVARSVDARNDGSNAGCELTNLPPNRLRKRLPTSFMNPAEITRSGS